MLFKYAWLPNFFSILRIIMSPIIAAMMIAGIKEGYGCNMLQVAFYLFVFAALTDLLDGYLARALNAQSELGEKLDLWGDKALVGLVFIGFWLGWLLDGPYSTLVEGSRAQPFVFISGLALILATSGRDFIVSLLRAKAAQKGKSIKTTFLAKCKTAILMTGQAFTLGGMSIFGYPHRVIGYGMIIIGALISLITAIDYFEKYKGVMESKNE